MYIEEESYDIYNTGIWKGGPNNIRENWVKRIVVGIRRVECVKRVSFQRF